MKTIYVTEKQWQKHTVGGGLERAVGDTGRTVGLCLCAAGLPDRGDGDKVIDLTAWKAENLVELDEPEDQPEERTSGLGQYEGRELVRRPRRKHEASRNRAELAAVLAVVAMMAVLILRLLLF